MKMKKVFYAIALLSFYFLLLEASSFALNLILIGKSFPHPNRYLLQDDIAISWDEPENIHPYLGYVYTFNDENKKYISELGFAGTESPIQTRSNGKMIIGIFGGSVAWQFSEDGIDALEKELKKSKLFANKKFIFLNFGILGYKQPQQLMTLNYIMALGGYLDIAINLDGFNEIVLPAIENIPNGVCPFFPRAWNIRIARNCISEEEVLTMATIMRYKKEQKKLASFFSSGILRYSATANLVWHRLDRYLSSKVSRNILKLFALKKGNSEENYMITGPTRYYKNERDMYQDLANIWKNCSFQMHKICAANGIRYFHFLQPCQYVPNSKMMKKEEAEIAFSESHPCRKPIEKGYPYLVKAGKKLFREGVNFHDLTMLFAHNGEVLYFDNVCHFNKKGYALLGTAIGKSVAHDIE